MRAIPELLPCYGFRGGEYMPVWSDEDHRIYRLDRRFFILESPGKLPRLKNITEDAKQAYLIYDAVILRGYIYVRCSAGELALILRYELTDLTKPAQLIRLEGQDFHRFGWFSMTTDGTHFYFTCKCGHAKSDYVISKYLLEGEQLTYVSDVVCGNEAGVFTHIYVRPNGEIYALRWHGEIYKFNADGSPCYLHRPFFNSPGIHQMVVIENNVYVSESNNRPYFRLVPLE
jgi:hypothetical protein